MYKLTIVWALSLLLIIAGCSDADSHIEFKPSAEPSGTQAHGHQAPSEPQSVADPQYATCGNTLTTLHLNGKSYSFMYGNSTTLTNILNNLSYDPDRICDCLPQFTVDTEFGTGYGIHLDQAYVRCDRGQAALTQEQVETIRGIVQWAESTNATYEVIP